MGEGQINLPKNKIVKIVKATIITQYCITVFMQNVKINIESSDL